MANAKTMQAIVEIAGSLSPSLEAAMKSAVDVLESLKDGAMDSASSYEKLEVELDAQEKALRALKKQYASFVIDQNQSSDEAKRLKGQIDAVNSEYISNKKRLQEAEDATSRWSEAVEDAGKDLDAWDVALGSLIAGGITAFISKAGEAVSAVAGLSKETREFRQDMNTLTTAYDNAGYSADTATETWKDLYAIFGEDDRAVEASNNIARIAQNQEDLSKWVMITTGIWGTYQDALPVEGLAEAAAETANTGQVTGVFADALNWSTEAAEMFAGYMGDDVVTAEDAFNAALDDCSTTQERQRLITETLTALYGDAAEQYGDTAGSIMDANKATADMELAQAALGDTMEPVTAAIDEGMAGLLQTALDLAEGIDMEEVVSNVTAAFDGLETAIQWCLDNWPTLEAILGTLTVLLIANKVALVAKKVAEISAKASAEGMTIAQYALNAAMNANPIGAIILVIGLLVAAFITLWNNSESFRQFWIGLWEGIQTAVGSAVDWIGQAWEALPGIIKAPLNGAISLLNWFIDKINSLSIDLPDWSILGDYAGKSIGFSIEHIDYLAKGGFTDGLSIAGEAGTEAVISFDKSVRDQNLDIWAQAGQMLGAQPSMTSQAGKLLNIDDFSLADYGSGSTIIVYYDFSGTVYSPTVETAGSGDSDNIMAKLRSCEAEFFDWLEEFIKMREVSCFV